MIESPVTQDGGRRGAGLAIRRASSEGHPSCQEAERANSSRSPQTAQKAPKTLIDADASESEPIKGRSAFRCCAADAPVHARAFSAARRPFANPGKPQA